MEQQCVHILMKQKCVYILMEQQYVIFIWNSVLYSCGAAVCKNANEASVCLYSNGT